MTQARDEVLVRQCLRGDTEAFGVLVRRYEGRVYAVAYGALLNHADAEEVAQRAFMRAFDGLPRLRIPDRFRPWLYRIAHSCARDRQRGYSRETPMDVHRVFGERPDPVIPQEEYERREDTVAVVEGALRTLPDTYRVPIAMRYMGGASYEEIAEGLAITVMAAQKRVSKGLARMRSYFARAGLEETAMDVLRTRCLVLPLGLTMAPMVMEEIAAQPTARPRHGSTGAGRWALCAFGGLATTVSTLCLFFGSWGVNADVTDITRGFGLAAHGSASRIGLYSADDFVTIEAPQRRTLVRPGDELVGWKPWKALLDPTVPELSAEHYASAPAGAVLNTDVGVWREFEPTHGTVIVELWLRPAPGIADVYLFLMIDGERGYEHGVGVYKHGSSGWWHHGNPISIAERPQGVLIPAHNNDMWVPFAPAGDEGQMMRIVHRTSEGSYDIYVDGAPKVAGLVVAGTRGKPFTGLWMKSGRGSDPLPSYFDDLMVTVDSDGIGQFREQLLSSTHQVLESR
ncbi:hypothetical protein CMK11_00340 [Candidatus Poribacteria bacterium]|nr:hypothetical protein [Candidatus Poribacteria bacterium]